VQLRVALFFENVKIAITVSDQIAEEE